MNHKTLLTTILAAVASALLPQTLLADDVKNAQGPWQVVSVEINGQDLSPTFRGAGVKIEGKKIELVLANGTKLVRAFRIDPTTSPKCVDFTNDKGEVTEGIYDLTEKKLKVCVFIKDGGKERPSEFKTMDGSGHILYILRQ